MKTIKVINFIGNSLWTGYCILCGVIIVTLI